MNHVIPKHLLAACAFFICSALVGYAAQFGDFTYEEYDTYIEITDYPEDATGNVTIPSEIVGKPVTSIGEWAFFECISLSSVTIPNSVISIGDRAFYRCTALTSITIPDSVTSIGEWAFTECASLTSVTIPDSVTTIGGLSFGSCSSLTAITVNAANPTFSSVDGVLFDKSQATLIQYPEGRAGAYAVPDSVTSIGTLAFYRCVSLSSVAIPNSVTSIEHAAFAKCTSLTSVTIPGNVTSIVGGAFGSCSSLTAITVHAANPAFSSVDGVLFDKSQATLIQYPGGKAGAYAVPDSVNSIGQFTFGGCDSLTSVTIPDSVISIGDWAFTECKTLTNITIGSGVSVIGIRAFHSCPVLTNVYFEGNAPAAGGVKFSGTDLVTIYYLVGTTGWGETFGGRPTEEAPLGGIPVDGLEGWFFSEWFGYYATTLDPWLFHAQHGFIYRYPESTNASLYFFDDAMGAWWWTSGTLYPFIYAFDPPADLGGNDVGSEWLFYFEGSNDPRWFSVLAGAGGLLSFDP